MNIMYLFKTSFETINSNNCLTKKTNIPTEKKLNRCYFTCDYIITISFVSTKSLVSERSNMECPQKTEIF